MRKILWKFLKYALAVFLTIIAILAFVLVFLQDCFNIKYIVSLKEICFFASLLLILLGLIGCALKVAYDEKMDSKFVAVQNVQPASGKNGCIRLYLKYNTHFVVGMLVTIYKFDKMDTMIIPTPIATGVVEFAAPNDIMQICFHCNTTQCSDQDISLLAAGNADLIKKLYVKPFALREHFSI